MTGRIASPRAAGWPRVSAAAATIVLWLLYAAAAGDPVFGEPPVYPALWLAAVVATCVAAVLAVGWVVLNVVRPAGAAPPTGLQRAVLYAVLGFAAGSAALSLLGFDLRYVLATSAIGSAIIGLAMQPTLSSLIAGMALSLDRTVQVGDGIVFGNETIRVEALNWRDVICRRRDGGAMVIPNATLANGEMKLLPRGQPVRGEVSIQVPGSVPPWRVAEIVGELIGDLPALDLTRPIQTVPTRHGADAAAIPYAVRYWVARFWESEDVEGEILRRLWYGFRRHGFEGLPAAGTPDVAGLLLTVAPRIAAETRAAAAREGEILLFGPGERVAPPVRYDKWGFILLSGDARESSEFDILDGGASLVPSLETLGRSGALRRVAVVLAVHIGPYAEFAVRERARSTASLDELCRGVAELIPDGAARDRFLSETRPEAATRFGPGTVFRCRRDASGSLVPDPRLTARRELTVLAVPPSVSLAMETAPPTARAP